ncbi:alanine adding enzyme [Pilibacter termitis]|uniref:Aminoacyltransferase FemA n=1 Tax=Pilibacter termitis TaxID=263852 RepID=A0A1T4MX62_9ENTE|nr:aminoacyltransferase [Pilibacter termitis]SJZ71592.1 alanine adding enzyme [Pilibacter termitis]
MEFTTLTEEEYQRHAQNHPLANFLQTKEMARVRKMRGWGVEYVGVKENGEVIATALLARMKIRFGYYYDIDGGFLADFDNKELLSVFTNGLKQHLKSNGALYLTMTPNVVYQQRDWNGNVVGTPKREILNELTSLGFVHHGFEKGFSTASPRWVFVKELRGLDEKSLRKSYQKDAIYSVKKTAQFGITLRELPYEELDKFKQLTEHTAKRRSFQDKPLDYYQAVFKEFGEKAKFMVAEINFKDYIENLRKREEELQAKLDRIAQNLEKTPNSSKMLNQQREFEAQKATHEKRIEEAEEFRKESGDEDVLLAGALFIIGKQEVIYLFSGTYDKYKNFYAPYLIQDEMMKFTIENGIEKYNFYGIDGNFDGSDGVLKFKQSFTGVVEEKIGSFDLVIQPMKYKFYQMLRRIADRARG